MGNFGNGKTETNSGLTFVSFTHPEKIVNIVSDVVVPPDGAHSILLTSDGDLYFAGYANLYFFSNTNKKNTNVSSFIGIFNNSYGNTYSGVTFNGLYGYYESSEGLGGLILTAIDSNNIKRLYYYDNAGISIKEFTIGSDNSYEDISICNACILASKIVSNNKTFYASYWNGVIDWGTGFHKFYMDDGGIINTKTGLSQSILNSVDKIYCFRIV